MQAVNPSRSWKYMLAGTLAGASGAIGLMLAVTLGLGVGILWQYAYFQNIVVLNDRATATVFEDVSGIPVFLWNSRWLLVAMAVGGIPLARMDRFAQRFPPPWNSRITANVLLAIVGAVMISGLLIQTDRSLYTDVLQYTGSGLPSLQALQSSVWYLLLIGVALSLGIGGALWLYWSWWYRHWQRWMRLDSTVAPKDAPETSSEDWFAQRRARERNQRMILLVFVGCVLFSLAAVSGYEYVRTTIQSGELSIEPTAPAAAVRLSIDQPKHAVIVENTVGAGTVAVTLLSASDRTRVADPVQLAFQDADLGSQRVALNVADLPTGVYLLNAQLGQGTGGRIGYALLQGNSTPALFAAILVGIGVGAALGLATLTISIIAEQRIAGTTDRM